MTVPSASIWVRILRALGRAVCTAPHPLPLPLALTAHNADHRRFTLSGTTYSCVATYEGNNVEIIANEQGSFTTPSFVSFTENERLIGEAAKNQAAMNPQNTVFDVKYVKPLSRCCSGSDPDFVSPIQASDWPSL
jgi:hypothetical protein